MDKAQILEQFVADLAHSSPATQKARAAYARRWLNFASDFPPEQWDRNLVQRFMAQMEKEGYAAGTRRNIYDIVRSTFAAAKLVWEAEKHVVVAGIDPKNPSAVPELLKLLMTSPPAWPMVRRDGPVVTVRDEVKPALTIEEIEAMIRTVKDGSLGTAAACFLALATTYGLRREEMRRLEPGDLDYSGGTIFINTAKGGDPRTHMLAEEILPYVKQHDFGEVHPLFNISWLYKLIETRAGVRHSDGNGFHAIRRRLDAILMDELPVPAVRLFLRWKMRASSDMPLRYYSKDLAENDAEALTVNPFLGVWKE